jgi:hypothetical protein
MNLRNRLILFGIVYLTLTVIFGFASTTPLSQADALSLAQSANAINRSAMGIFENNIQIALLEFIPGFGPAFGAYSSYSTGLVLSAIAQTNQTAGISGFELFLGLVLTPIYWIEFACYSAAVEESSAIIISFRNRDFLTTEWKWVIGTILLVVVTLFVSARLEVELINFVK